MTIKRNTMQRSVVLETVKSLGNHPTADHVYEEVIKTHPSISRATVYRNLNILSESGEIRKLEIPTKADRFDHMTNPHYHAKCIVCDRVEDIEMEELKGLEESIKNTNGFIINGHNILFNGICPNCQEKADN